MTSLRALAALACAGAFVTMPSGTAASAGNRVEPGSALASSSVVGAVLVYGGFKLPITVATSTASYQADQAQATSQGIYTGMVSVSGGTGASCGGDGTGGSAPAPTSAPPFTPITASSADGGEHRTTGQLLVGSGSVAASPAPLSAQADTAAVAVGVPGLVEVSGHSTASVAYAAGRQRTATADVTTDVKLLGGLVILSGLSWHATDRSGSDEGSHGTFSLAGVTVSGLRLPVGTADQLATAIATANTVLSAAGLRIDLPTTSTKSGDAVVTGLTIRILGSAALKAVVQPLVKLKGPVQDLLGELLTGPKNCWLDQLATLVGTTELVGDVFLGALSGGGEIDLFIGGANAGTAAPPEFENPFDGGNEPPPPNAAPPPKSGGVVPAPVTGLPVVNAAPMAPAVQPGIPVQAPVTSMAAYEIGCVSTNTADTRSCSSGASAAVAFILLGCAVLLFATDLYQSRRRRPIVRRSLS